jgi:hypothetical protein
MTVNNFPGIGYKNQGIDFNFFQNLAVNWSTFGGNAADGYQPDMIIKFSTMGLIFSINGTGSTL